MFAFSSNPNLKLVIYRSKGGGKVSSAAQDASKDMMITANLEHHDRETEFALTPAKSGTSCSQGSKIVDI